MTALLTKGSAHRLSLPRAGVGDLHWQDPQHALSALEHTMMLPWERALLWCVVPSWSSAGVAHHGMFGRSAKSMASYARGRGTNVMYAGNCIFVAHTHNQRRVLGPVATALNGTLPGWTFPCRSFLGAARLAELFYVAGRMAGKAQVLLGLHKTTGLRDRLVVAAQSVVAAYSTLKAKRPRVLVVANQHSVIARAWLLAASVDGLATAYVPHAPTADVPHYRDLPVGLACLWGEEDRRHYRRWRAREAGIAVTGYPVALGQRQVTSELQGTVIYAPSPVGEDVLARHMRMVEQVGRPVVVGLHPRLRRAEMESLVPREWSILSETTLSALHKRPLAVVQSNSGIGLEAMALGVPVIQLDASATTYAYLREGVVQHARTPVELKHVIDVIEQSGSDGRWCAASRRWLAQTGRAAATEVADRLGALPAGSCEPVLNGWPL
jgi:hypothetical protein